jgi:hypothetical protein
MTLNDFIIQNAGCPGDDDTDFLRIFGSTEVYCKVEAPGHQLASGPVTTSRDLVLHMRTAKMKFGHMALFFASQEGLSRPFGGLPLMKAVEMAYEMKGVDGLLIQSTGDAWFAVKKKGLKNTFDNQHLPTTLNEYIIRHAGEPGDAGFLRKFASTEVFFRIKPPERRWFSIKALKHRLTSDPASTSPAPLFYVQMIESGIGYVAVLFTFKDKLRRPFRGMPLIKALETLYHVPDAKGLLIQSTVDLGYAVVSKDDLKNFLDKEGIDTRPG